MREVVGPPRCQGEIVLHSVALSFGSVSVVLGAFTLALLWRETRRPTFPPLARRALIASSVLYAIAVILLVLGLFGSRLTGTH